MLVNEVESDAEYCAEMALKHDRERVLCALLAPVEARQALISLVAWNHEVAKVGEIVSDHMVGLIRFQWWRDALEEIYGEKTVREHAVVQELLTAIKTTHMPRESFEEVLTAREADLEPMPFHNLAALDAYATSTAGALGELWVRALGVTRENALDAARHVGAAWGLVGVLRSIHHQAHQGRMLLPGINVQDLLEKGFSEDMAQVVESICAMAEEHIALARSKEAPKEAFSALAFTIPAEDFLKRFRKAKYDPFHPSIEKGRATRALKLWIAKLRKRY